MYDLIIVGGGPAGMTCGLYAARAGLKALLLEGELIGGQASTTNVLENYPGFPPGVGGPELMMSFEEQATRAGLEVRYEGVQRLDLAGPVKRVHTGGALEARALVLAMGAQRRKLGVPGEQELTGRGVSYCATCDGALYRGKRVAVVGGGDTAVEDALYLAPLSPVVLIHRRGELRAQGVGARQVMGDARVEKRMGYTVERIDPAPGGLNLSLQGTAGQPPEHLEVAALFVGVGTLPLSQLVAGQLVLDEEGYVVAGEDTRTSVEGVFAAGDLRRKPLKQVVTAVADGAVAAYMAGRYLSAGR